jgi:Icc-related predicted phosphoesterase
MPLALFASDLHGSAPRYRALWERARQEQPRAIFLGGDLLPPGYLHGAQSEDHEGDFLEDFLAGGFLALRAALGPQAPRVLLVLGNDDPAAAAPAFERAASRGAWEPSLHLRKAELAHRPIYGYGCVPPTPFALKDWERYDVSRYVDPGAVSPEDGWRSVPMERHLVRFHTIHRDLDHLTGVDDLSEAVFLFHTPPHDTALDHAGLEGQAGAPSPLDSHVGSIAVRRLIERRQPWLTLHGHVHGSWRRTGAWMERLGRTTMISAAHDGPELALVRFDLDRPWNAERELIGA